MTRIKLWIAGAVCLPVAMAAAQSSNMDEPLFRANEFSLDLFGSGSVGQQTINHLSGDRVRDNGRLGAGLGLNYFITKYVGFGADVYSEDTSRSFIDNASGSLILRLPIEKIHLAPYAFAGGGRQFDPSGIWFGQAGAGLELRFTRHIGIFADARYVMCDHAGNFGVGRAGLRITF